MPIDLISCARLHISTASIKIRLATAHRAWRGYARLGRALLYGAMILSLTLPGSLLAQSNDNANAGNANETAETPRPALEDREALEAFVDGLMASHLEEHHIPGAAVAVVHEGEIVLAKGYGYADLDTLTPVDAETTLFRIGSVAKLFTWTAVMQLVEADELDLDADINTYLATTDVHVPATFPARITMGHLMAHTAGFEDRNIGLFAREETSLEPLESLLADLPARVRPPGEVSAYSNDGSALAALAVAQISGLEWEEYIESHILEPLGMTRTTMRQPVPADLRDDLAQGYSYQGGRHQAEGFEYVRLAPAGAASATTTDMARFMLAHLQLGRLDGARILEEATARQMQTQHFTHDPLLPGMAHGFMEYHIEEDYWLGHSGDTIWFHTGLFLHPRAEPGAEESETGTGIYVVYNGVNGAVAREAFFQAMRARYFQDPTDILPTPPTTTDQQLARFTGDYRTTRRAETTPEKVGALLATFSIGTDPEGYLTLSALGWEPSRWTEIGPGRFREVEPTGILGEDELVFHFDPVTDRPQRLYYSPVAVMAFERTAWFEGSMFHIALAVAALLIFLGGVIAWPIQLWRSRKRPGRKTRWGQWAYGVGALTALLLLIHLIILLIALSDTTEIVFGMPPLLNVAGAFVLISLPLAIAMLGLAGVLWAREIWRVGGRIFYTLAALIIAIHLWQLWYWNLLLAAFTV